MVIIWLASFIEFAPRNDRNPAGEFIALTELTNAFLLHELYKSHAVFAFIIMFTFCTITITSGFWGFGTGKYPSSTSTNEDCYGEQAY